MELAGSGPARPEAEPAYGYGTAVFLGLTRLLRDASEQREEDLAARRPGGAEQKTFEQVESTKKVYQHSTSPQAREGLAVPAVPSTPVSATPGGAVGFDGLRFHDSYEAGTGSHADRQIRWEPADPALAVGNGYVVESINCALAVYDSDGNRLTLPNSLNQFYRQLPASLPDDEERAWPHASGDMLADPKCYFDPVGQRFFHSVLKIESPGPGSRSARCYVLLAVSATADPTGDWKVFSVDTTSDGRYGTPHLAQNACYSFHPLLGGNQDAIVLSLNLAENVEPAPPYKGAQLYVLSRQALAEAEDGDAPRYAYFNTATVPTADPEFPYWGWLQPAACPRPRSGTQFFLCGSPLNEKGIPRPLDNRIVVWSLTGTETLNEPEPKLSLHHEVLVAQALGAPFLYGVTQKDGPAPLRDALGNGDPLPKLDGKAPWMTQVAEHDGFLFGALNTLVAAPDGQPDGNRLGIAYFVVDAADADAGRPPRIVRQGYLAVEGQHVFDPAIAVGSDGQGGMTFTLSGPDHHPSAAYVRIDRNGARGPVHIAAAGAAPQDGFTGYSAFTGNGVPPGTSRWGDYTAAVADGDAVWMANAYVPDGPRSHWANVGTYIYRLSPSG
ncbi:hypothetical protein O7627_15145 [Solwaraspora sp. WMMD1047]|uniref:hypothetical protein n=1 Tax=Solwaraspora sp. WMMD1047 TaxID=3016102 RepID=UPI0024170FD9|nr:hypothetical protein [Solwaraspora sp. WMMD1047]MDG4830628.1 hypothetical protein [Solwaraspora sp. WMMD1047]